MSDENEVQEAEEEVADAVEEPVEDNGKKRAGVPQWGYKKGKDGEIIHKLFSEGRPPRGWADSPAKCK